MHNLLTIDTVSTIKGHACCSYLEATRCGAHVTTNRGSTFQTKREGVVCHIYSLLTFCSLRLLYNASNPSQQRFKQRSPCSGNLESFTGRVFRLFMHYASRPVNSVILPLPLPAVSVYHMAVFRCRSNNVGCVSC